MNLTKSQKKTLKRLKDRERRFKNMSKARQRVAIAKDVLEQLNAHKIEATEKVWVNINTWKANRPSKGSDLRTEIVKAPKCYTCALGALFVCSVMRDARARVEDAYFDITQEVAGPTALQRQLEKYFTESQARLIELAFERGNGWAVKAEDKRDQDAIRFGKQFPSEQIRLEAIMHNIVANNGTFNPPKLSS